MGQKVNPIGFRLGVYRDWDARWFARGHGKSAKNSYGAQLMEDFEIRKFLESALDKAEVARLEIEKAGDNVRIVVHSGRPGVVIGRRGQEIESLRNLLAKRLQKTSVEISVHEVKQPELNATLVARNIADQLVRRVSYKKAMKRAASSAMRSGAKGVKIRCSGRLLGAEIARKEGTFVGSIPLHTLRSDIDYGFAEAKTTYGIIGVKVLICKGEYKNNL